MSIEPLTHAVLIDFFAQLVPAELAEDWDNCGLQLGSRYHPLRGVLLALDFSRETLEEASRCGANFIFTHHPFFFKSLKNLDLDTPVGHLINQAVKAGISVYSAHTNLDSLEGGVNDCLAEICGLSEARPLQPVERRILKLVTFVPPADLDDLAAALFAAGAGHLGRELYRDCSFRSSGVGSFRPGKGAQPRLGEPGRLNLVDEIRFETVFQADRCQTVLQALHDNHPYEVPAYDLYSLTQVDSDRGLGRFGILAPELTMASFAELLKERLGLASLRLVGGSPAIPLQRVALCGGSGFSLYGLARAAGADVFVTGDLKYHEARQVLDEEGPPVIDIGHFAGERPVLEFIAERLRLFFKKLETSIPVRIAESETEPWQIV